MSYKVPVDTSRFEGDGWYNLFFQDERKIWIDARDIIAALKRECHVLEAKLGAAKEQLVNTELELKEARYQLEADAKGSWGALTRECASWRLRAEEMESELQSSFIRRIGRSIRRLFKGW